MNPLCNLSVPALSSLLKVPKVSARETQLFECLLPPPAEVKKKTVSLYGCRSNMCPENSTANNHDFQMHCFEETTSCKACSMLLRYFNTSLSVSFNLKEQKFSQRLKSPNVSCCRGIFFQGYRCTRCKMAAHKECLGRVPACGRNSGLYVCIHLHVCVYMLLLISLIIISHVGSALKFTDHSVSAKKVRLCGYNSYCVFPAGPCWNLYSHFWLLYSTCQFYWMDLLLYCYKMIKLCSTFFSSVPSE